MSSSSLSSVVSSLVRASMGTSVSSTVTDEELDRHVAELILKEAKQKAEKYLKDGVTAYLPDTSADNLLPRPNKRFLSAIIKNTDDHNKAILQAQFEAAQEIQAARLEEERKERRARALEASDAERIRRLMGGGRRRDHWDGSRDRHSKQRDRSRDRGHGSRDEFEEGSSRHKRRRSASRSHDRSKDHSDHGSLTSRKRDHERHSDREDHGYSRRRHRHRHRHRSNSRSTSRSPTVEKPLKRTRRDDDRRSRTSIDSNAASHNSTPLQKDLSVSSIPEAETTYSATQHASRSPTPGPPPPSSPPPPLNSEAVGLASKKDSQNTPKEETSENSRLEVQMRQRRELRLSPTLSEEEDIERQSYRTSRIRREKQTRSPKSKSTSGIDDDTYDASVPSSKMDKYFEPSYDPRLDVAPLTIPQIPNTGLIDGADFEGWEAMLDIIRQRREDKAERKRLEKMGLLPEEQSIAKEKKKKNEDKGSTITIKGSDRWGMEAGNGLMGIEYKKRGAVREWDMGKEGVI